MKKYLKLFKKSISIIQSKGFKSFFLEVYNYALDPRKKALRSEIMNWKRKDGNNKNILIKKECVLGMVSVIIPIYDRTDELRESIESILNQTYKNFELILVTDGSPGETIDVVESYRKNIKVKIFHYYNNTGNAVRGRNKGIKEAKGEFIAFQDSDDIAELDRLENSLQFIREKGSDLVYGGWRAMVHADRVNSGIDNGQEFDAKECDFKELLKDNYLCQSAVMVKRDAILSVGGLKKKMEYREDHELWLRLLFFGFSFYAMPCVVTNLRLHLNNNELKFKDDDEKWYNLMLSEYKIKNVLSPKIFYIIPGIGISGGIAVVLQYANRLLKLGYDVSILTQDFNTQLDWFPDQMVAIYSIDTDDYVKEGIDILIATSWTTAPSLDLMNAKRKIYFVQSDERRFYNDKEEKELIGETYKLNYEYMTEALWIKQWLNNEFGHDAYYVPNGIDLDIFHKTEPLKSDGKKPRILIEGAINVPYKGMDDAHEAVKDLDCELWIISNNGKPKKDWRYDRFFEKVPYGDMAKIYSSCDIFLKMSRVEGFFGPPMEAMACGCAVVVGKVTGYDEYIIDRKNALVVEQGDIIGAKNAIRELINKPELKNAIIREGFITAKKWSWKNSLEILIKLLLK